MAVEMDRVGDDFLPRPGFTGNQHGRLGGGHLLNNFQQSDHRAALANDVLPVEFFSQPLFQIFVFPLQPVVFGRPGNGHLQLIEIQRFGQIIVCPFLQRLDGCLHRSISRHDDQGNGRIDLLDLFECFNARHVHHPDIHQNQIEGSFADFFHRD